MKKRVIAVVALLVLVVSIGSFTLFKKNQTTIKNENSSKTKQVEFKVKSAFADIDSDMIVEVKDSEDNDKKYDYIIITFTNAIVDTKKEDSSNPFNIKNYTFDNAPLPKGTVITPGDTTQVIIKMPDEYLKGINSPHSLNISKYLKDKDGQSITGSLDTKLPYSIPNNAPSNVTTNTPDKQSTNSSANNSQKNDAKTGDTTNANGSDKKSTPDAALPKFTVKIITNIPQTTIVAVTLDNPNPENYKVSVGGTTLELKKNNKGEKVFVGSTEKEYSFDEVNKLIKIEKVK